MINAEPGRLFQMARLLQARRADIAKPCSVITTARSLLCLGGYAPQYGLDVFEQASREMTEGAPDALCEAGQ